MEEVTKARYLADYRGQTTLDEIVRLSRRVLHNAYTQADIARLCWLAEVVWAAIIAGLTTYTRRLARHGAIPQRRTFWDWQTEVKTTFALRIQG